MAAIDPDERCGICEETRENHGDANHMFSAEGELIPKKPAPPAKNTPPAERSNSLVRDPLTNVVLRLVEQLIANNLLKPEDLMYVMGGIDADNRRQVRAKTTGDNSGRVSARGSGVDPQ